jgi:hypothetical protein
MDDKKKCAQALRKVLRSALEGSEYSALSLSRELGKKGTYIHDFLSGKKGSVGCPELIKIERILDMEPGTLTEIVAPRIPKPVGGHRRSYRKLQRNEVFHFQTRSRYGYVAAST